MIETILFALLPIVLLIAFGAVLRRLHFVEPSFWAQAERLAYFILLPALFFHGLAMADLSAVPVLGMAVVLVGATVAVAGLVLALRPLIGGDGPAFTSVFQGAIRFNNYVGVTAAAGLYGTQGIVLAAVCNAAIIPTVNLLCILVFARHGSSRLDARGILRQLATNPLVLGSLGGISFQLLGFQLPAAVAPALQTLGAAALPLGLLCIGAALEFGSVRRWLGPVVISSAIKFIVMPLVTLILARLFGLSGPALLVALLFQALPTASSAYILARQLGGDAPLMAGITATQTVLAMVAMPLVLAALAPLIGL